MDPSLATGPRGAGNRRMMEIGGCSFAKIAAARNQPENDAWGVGHLEMIT